MAVVNVHEAKTHLSRLIARVLAGEEIVIARDSVPAVRLLPVTPPAVRRFGAYAGQIAADARFGEPLPDAELAGWDDDAGDR